VVGTWKLCEGSWRANHWSKASKVGSLLVEGPREWGVPSKVKGTVLKLCSQDH
jgi:hypothetical protein